MHQDALRFSCAHQFYTSPDQSLCGIRACHLVSGMFNFEGGLLMSGGDILKSIKTPPTHQ